MQVCSAPGCMKLVKKGRCEKHSKEERPSAAKRGYDHKWRKQTELYKRENPLCVTCLKLERVEPVYAVDHIIPHRGNKQLFNDPENWQSICEQHHNQKTIEEQFLQFNPQQGRIVLCGLPGTGKTTEAKAMGQPYWDADEQDLHGIHDIQTMRARWIQQQDECFTIIVASTLTAMKLAALHHCYVRHLVCSENERQERLRARMVGGGRKN